MQFLTDRKRAEGRGSAKTGTHHHWMMTVTSVVLIFLVPIFVYQIGHLLGASQSEIQAAFAEPWRAVIVSLGLMIGLYHFNVGAQVLIEDYVHGAAQKYTLIAATALSYGLMAFGVFAILRMAL